MNQDKDMTVVPLDREYYHLVAEPRKRELFDCIKKIVQETGESEEGTCIGRIIYEISKECRNNNELALSASMANFLFGRAQSRFELYKDMDKIRNQ